MSEPENILTRERSEFRGWMSACAAGSVSCQIGGSQEQEARHLLNLPQSERGRIWLIPDVSCWSVIVSICQKSYTRETRFF